MFSDYAPDSQLDCLKLMYECKVLLDYCKSEPVFSFVLLCYTSSCMLVWDYYIWEELKSYTLLFRVGEGLLPECSVGVKSAKVTEVNG